MMMYFLFVCFAPVCGNDKSYLGLPEMELVPIVEKELFYFQLQINI